MHGNKDLIIHAHYVATQGIFLAINLDFTNLQMMRYVNSQFVTKVFKISPKFATSLVKDYTTDLQFVRPLVLLSHFKPNCEQFLNNQFMLSISYMFKMVNFMHSITKTLKCTKTHTSTTLNNSIYQLLTQLEINFEVMSVYDKNQSLKLLQHYTVMTCSVTLGTGRTHINVNHGTYRSGELVSGTLTTALYLGEITTGTNTGQAGGWTDRQLGNWERVARDGNKAGITREKTTTQQG